MTIAQKNTLFWFRRDLRLEDNHGLYQALALDKPVIGFFIFDTHILDRLEDRDDARVTFLHQRIRKLQQEIHARGGQLIVRHGTPEEAIPEVIEAFQIASIVVNHDEDPYARQRDKIIRDHCTRSGVSFHAFKDHVIFGRKEVLKSDETPYTVFTPYSRKWSQQMMDGGLTPDGTPSCFRSFPSEVHPGWYKAPPVPMPSLASMGFSENIHIPVPEPTFSVSLLDSYDRTRDYPAVNGTSRMGIHLRFGTVSIRALARKAYRHNQTYLKELIWREFYAMILYHFPHVVGNSFRPEYDQIEWRNHEEEFRLWCEGQTGYPLVDAGMRQLNATGYMHNRVRMVVASFLTKHLLIDWRWGEAYFARKLLDFELASNNGGWQWAAGCGTDAAPYFRIFNPTAQQKKFDPDFSYIKTWVREWGTPEYPAPIVEHSFARERCLETYRSGLNRQK